MADLSYSFLVSPLCTLATLCSWLGLPSPVPASTAHLECRERDCGPSLDIDLPLGVEESLLTLRDIITWHPITVRSPGLSANQGNQAPQGQSCCRVEAARSLTLSTVTH